MIADWPLPEHVVVELRAKSSRYAIVIPVLNEGDRIRRQLARMAEQNASFDCIIVDGGSTDGALDVDLLQNAHVRTLMTKTGAGRLSAQLRLGLGYAMAQGYEGVILIDGNNKDNPEAIPEFARRLNEGYDHVQGSRFVPGGRAINNPRVRIAGLRLLHAPLISLAAGFRYTDTTNGFRAYSRRFLLDERVQPFREVFTGYELHYFLAIRAARLGFRVVEIPVERVYPQGKVPTKISSVRGNLEILMTLLRATVGAYDPD